MTGEFPGLGECAALCGFSTPQYFCKVFKEEYGTTPMKYLKKQI